MKQVLGFTAAIISCLFFNFNAYAQSPDESSASTLAPDFHPQERGWMLVWSDEFDGVDLDFTKWEIEESCWGGGNDERQCYTAWDKNVDVEDGILKLMAFRKTVSGPKYPQGHPDRNDEKVTQKYVSGKVRTRGLADWKYGRFEARMKLPKGQGTWPAFWMLPADDVYGKWAASGEIDILEAVNLGERCDECVGNVGENRSSGALHYGGVWPDNKFSVKFSQLPGGVDTIDLYHIYAVEWGEGRIDWFVDDVLFFTMTSDDWYSAAVEKSENPNAPFDQNFYLMLNLAVGGGLSEKNNKKGFNPKSFPAEVLVDWVRVYQCEHDIGTGRACMQGE